jgi:hypothetical protein
MSAPGSPWSESYLAFALTLAPEDVVRPGGDSDSGISKASRREWAWVQTAQRLVECHGHAGALARLNGYGHE